MIACNLPMLFQRNSAGFRTPLADTPSMLPMLTHSRAKSMAVSRRMRSARPDGLALGRSSAPFLLRDAVRDTDRTMEQLESFVDSVTNHLLAYSPLSLASTFPNRYLSVLRPVFEWEETNDGFSLISATPGLPKEDLNVEIVKGDTGHEGALYLVVSGGPREQPDAPAATDASAEAGAGAAQHVESSRPVRGRLAKFEHRMRLPADVDEGSLQALYKNGLLEVRMARRVAGPAEHRNRINIK